MKKITYFMGVFAFLFLFSLTSNAASYGYVSPRVGLSDIRETELKDHHDASFMPGVAVGTAVGPLRAEVEYTHLTEADIEAEKGHDVLNAKFNRVMVNGYVDLRLSPGVRPYVTAGAGVARYDVSYQGEDLSGSNFVWNAGAGVGFYLNRNLALDVGCRYVDLGKVELEKQEKEMTFDTVETYAGLRFMF